MQNVMPILIVLFAMTIVKSTGYEFKSIVLSNI